MIFAVKAAKTTTSNDQNILKYCDAARQEAVFVALVFTRITSSDDIHELSQANDHKRVLPA